MVTESTKDEMPVVNVLGSHVPVVELDDALNRMEALIAKRDGICRHVINTGFHGIWEGHNRPEFGEVLNAADFWVPDGIAVSLIARAHGHRMPRIGGPEFVEAFLERADQKNYRSFFFGETPETLESLETVLKRKYPGHEIVGTFSPPFRQPTEEEDEEHVRMINESGADVLWVALGCPKQEQWIYDHSDRLTVPVAVGIGAIFGFLSGTVKHAPLWIGNLGFEWAYRVLKEPKKCWRRSFVQGPQFVTHVLMELAGIKKYEKEDEAKSSD